jgi:type I site-specific restriction-modification system R (restriction) subunit
VWAVGSNRKGIKSRIKRWNAPTNSQSNEAGQEEEESNHNSEEEEEKELETKQMNKQMNANPNKLMEPLLTNNPTEQIHLGAQASTNSNTSGTKRAHESSDSEKEQPPNVSFEIMGE